MKKFFSVFTLLILMVAMFNEKNVYAEEEATTEIVDWGMKAIKVEQAHKRGLTGKGIKIAVLDTGVDMRPDGTYHEDLKIEYATYELKYREDYPEDIFGHGTHVAGIIGAQINGIGTIGVAPDAEIYSIKVATEFGIDRGALNRALEWCINNDIDIINYSAGYYTTHENDEETEKLNELILKADSQGIFIIASSGNGDEENKAYDYVAYPAVHPAVLAVGSVNEDLTWSDFSNYGEGLDFVAPGNKVYSSWYPNRYKRESGTSMAAPHVSGVVALYKQKFPNYTKDQIIEEMKKNAIDLWKPGYDIYYGYGLIQAPPLEVSDIGSPLLDNVNNRPVLENGAMYSEWLYDNDKGNYMFMYPNGEFISRFENPVHPKGLDIGFYNAENQQIDLTFYDSLRNPIKTISITEDGIHTFDEITEDVHFIGVKNTNGTDVKISELEILGSVYENPKKIVDFHTKMILNADGRIFFGEDFTLTDLVPKFGVEGKTFTVDKATDWSDKENRFTKVRVSNEDLDIQDKWINVKNGELPEIQVGDLTNTMYGQIVQNDGYYIPHYMYDDNLQAGATVYGNSSLTYEFDNPVTITHMFVRSRPDNLDNRLKISFTDANGMVFEEEIDDEDLFYRYFAFNQSYENIKKVRIQNLSTNTLYLPEIGFYGEENEEKALPSVEIEQPVKLYSRGFKLYDNPNAPTYTQIDPIDNDITVKSIRGYGLNENENRYDWLQIEYNGELKWVTPSWGSVDFIPLHENGLIDKVGIAKEISDNVIMPGNIVNNSGGMSSTFNPNGFVEYQLNSPISIKQVHIYSNQYIDNSDTHFQLEFFDENKNHVYSKNITRDDLYKRIIDLDKTYENISYFKLTNVGQEAKSIDKIEFK